MDLWLGITLGAVALALGGILKGATGAGAPLIAVPLLALLYNVPLAVAIFSLPNLLANVWQVWSFRAHRLEGPFPLRFALAGSAGALTGTFLLVNLSSEVLMTGVALLVLVYVAFRLMKPDALLPRRVAERVAAPLGFLGGLLQGAGGLSAPVSITLLNAMGLSRPQFIVTISTFFVSIGVVQIPTLIALGILTPERALLSLGATLPIWAAIPVGAALGRRFSKETFDRVILAVLVVISLRLLAAVIL